MIFQLNFNNFKFFFLLSYCSGERPYKCTYCDKKFSQKQDLDAHIRRHTGERFKCELCGDGFIQLYHLTQHKRNMHQLNVQSTTGRLEKFHNINV